MEDTAPTAMEGQYSQWNNSLFPGTAVQDIQPDINFFETKD